MNGQSNLPKRRRGRPSGSGIDDAGTLAAVADTLVAHPGMKPTTAMKRSVRGIQPSHLRRLQVKWKVDSEGLRTEARQRVQEREEARTRADVATRSTTGLSQRAITIAGLMDPLQRMMRDIANSPLQRMMRDIANSPLQRMMRDIENSPLQRMMRDIENSPLWRMMRDIENSPLRRAIREMQQRGA